MQLSLDDEIVRQGAGGAFVLPDACQNAQTVRLPELGLTLENQSGEPNLLSVSTSGVPLGTYDVEVDCGENATATGNLFVFRQTGGETGGANTIATLSLLGITSSVLFVGRSAARHEEDEEPDLI